MNGFYNKVIEILKRYGFRLVRHGKGDHEIWGNGNVNVTVDRHTRSRFTANKTLKDAGISERIR